MELVSRNKYGLAFTERIVPDFAKRKVEAFRDHTQNFFSKNGYIWLHLPTFSYTYLHHAALFAALYRDAATNPSPGGEGYVAGLTWINRDWGGYWLLPAATFPITTRASKIEKQSFFLKWLLLPILSYF
jgi:hypothetical protein